jgi:hypothetical protein
MGEAKRRAKLMRRTDGPPVSLHVLPINAAGLLPPDQQAELQRVRDGIRALLDGQVAGVGLAALEITLGEVLAGTFWADTSLDVQLARSRRMVETVAREVQSSVAGRA